jgi:outer membrane protein TolC
MPHVATASLVLLTTALIAAGCASSEQFALESDAIVGEILDGSSERLNAERRRTLEKPRTAVPESEQSAVPQDAAAQVESKLRVLSLRECLEQAVQTNRRYIGELESLYSRALSLHSTRHSFGPLLSATLNSVFAGTDRLTSSSTSFGSGVSQRLPWGGSLSVSAGASATQEELAQVENIDASTSIGISQPLLRGFGHEAAMESLVTAERGMLYSIREFELFREGFSIDVARSFYSLVQQKQGLENQRKNLDDVAFALRQAEAMVKLGDINEIERLRAKRSLLTSQNDLISAEEDLRRALESFRIFLGLPPDVQIDVKDEVPAYQAIDYDVESAIDVAFKNRLDVLTRRQQLEDSARGLRITSQATLPDLGLSASYGVGASFDPDRAAFDPGDPSWSVGFDLSIPVDRTSDRQSVREAQIGHRQALRGFEEFCENLVVDIRSAFRELKRRTQSLEIQRELITDQERNTKIAKLRFEQGEISYRDQDEAQQALLDAKNALVREQVEYEIARLELLRDLGILFIDDRGMWSE